LVTGADGVPEEERAGEIILEVVLAGVMGCETAGGLERVPGFAICSLLPVRLGCGNNAFLFA